MACRLFGAKLLPTLGYCQLDPEELISVTFLSRFKFSFSKMHLKISSAKWRPFCLGRNELPWNITKILYSVLRGNLFNIDTTISFFAQTLWNLSQLLSFIHTNKATVDIDFCSKSSSSSYFTVDLYPFRSKKIGSHGFQRTMVVLSKKVIDWLTWRERKTTL